MLFLKKLRLDIESIITGISYLFPSYFLSQYNRKVMVYRLKSSSELTEVELESIDSKPR